MSNRRRGFSHERDLVQRFWNHGFAVIRSPASGSKAKTILYPDIVAIYHGKVLAIEAKTIRRERTIYLKKQQVEKLIEFSKRAGGEAYIAVKIVGTGEWRFISLNSLQDTGGLKITKTHLSASLKLEDLVSIVKGVRRLGDFSKH
ncbi:Holliday junction resolvase [Thermosphaera chiliense]|uniref:Crossover junction endodeoxyribonuclease Hjc n=1 Tax=Thermosphaera chiliense TaxID=3402707 RepID=A0A7M1US71_9CREN|nr:Holliday junction resolvase Hjc [Thermosphaera aggregans]QOR95135.1 Holliday junction resolvase [Thermosphaera aggregans]